MQVRHLSSDSRLLQRRGQGRHNRRLGDGSGGRSVFGGSYVFLVLAEVNLCGGKAFGGEIADKSAGEARPCGEETRGGVGGPF